MRNKILVIDDEIDFLRSVKEWLEGAGYGVVTAANAKEGMDRLRRDNPDLIILDIIMPLIDGYDFFTSLKSDPDFSHIPVIILTARSEREKDFLSLGADKFMSKPVAFEDLVAAVESVLSKGKE